MKTIEYRYKNGRKKSYISAKDLVNERISKLQKMCPFEDYGLLRIIAIDELEIKHPELFNKRRVRY